MKLISSSLNKYGERLIAEDAVFDPSLATLDSIDQDEMVFVLRYDALENGFPLGLPLFPLDANLMVKLTPTGIHTSMTMSDFGDYVAARTIYDEYGDGDGNIEFNVRMTDEEKLQLMQRIVMLMPARIRSSTP